MSKWPIVPLGELLTPVSRPQNVQPDAAYRILGAHWYAEGLYTKEINLVHKFRQIRFTVSKRETLFTTDFLHGKDHLQLRRETIITAISLMNFPASALG